MTNPRHLTLDQQAALLVVERLVLDPDTTWNAARLLRVIEHADPDTIDDDGPGDWLRVALAEAVTGLTVDEVRAERDRTLYRDGQRVRLPANPCPRSLRKLDNTEDPLRERPCVHRHGADHPGHCEFADAPAPAQRAALRQFRAEVTSVAQAFGVKPGDLVPGL